MQNGLTDFAYQQASETLPTLDTTALNHPSADIYKNEKPNSTSRASKCVVTNPSSTASLNDSIRAPTSKLAKCVVNKIITTITVVTTMSIAKKSFDVNTEAIPSNVPSVSMPNSAAVMCSESSSVANFTYPSSPVTITASLMSQFAVSTPTLSRPVTTICKKPSGLDCSIESAKLNLIYSSTSAVPSAQVLSSICATTTSVRIASPESAMFMSSLSTRPTSFMSVEAVSSKSPTVMSATSTGDKSSMPVVTLSPSFAIALSHTSSVALSPTSAVSLSPTAVSLTSAVALSPTNSVAMSPTSAVALSSTSAVALSPTSAMALSSTSAVACSPTSAVALSPTNFIVLSPTSAEAPSPISAVAPYPTTTVALSPTTAVALSRTSAIATSSALVDTVLSNCNIAVSFTSAMSPASAFTVSRTSSSAMSFASVVSSEERSLHGQETGNNQIQGKHIWVTQHYGMLGVKFVEDYSLIDVMALRSCDDDLRMELNQRINYSFIMQQPTENNIASSQTNPRNPDAHYNSISIAAHFDCENTGSQRVVETAEECSENESDENASAFNIGNKDNASDKTKRSNQD